MLLQLLCPDHREKRGVDVEAEHCAPWAGDIFLIVLENFDRAASQRMRTQKQCCEDAERTETTSTMKSNSKASSDDAAAVYFISVRKPPIMIPLRFRVLTQ